MTRGLAGVWELASCEHRLAGGRVERPLGRRPLGRLVYTADGAMLVMLMARGRPRSRSGRMFEETGAELAAAGRAFIAYSGRYETRGRWVLHRVDMSFFPDWIGTVQVRLFRIKGDRITFETRPFRVKGREQTARLVWRRAAPAPSARRRP